MRRALVSVLLASACAPQSVEVTASFKFTGEQVAGAFAQALPAQVLAQVGGSIPETWPANAPPALMTVQTVQRARLDFSRSGSSAPSKTSGLRLSELRMTARSGADGPLLPEPAEMLVFAAPYTATTLSDPGVRRLARGAWPPSITPAADGGIMPFALLDMEPGGRGVFADILRGADKIALFVVLRVPLDTRRDPRRPRASAIIDLVFDVEIVP